MLVRQSGVNESCHFFTWYEGNKTCELGYMDQGWHFNYTDDPETQKQVSVNTGTLDIELVNYMYCC